MTRHVAVDLERGDVLLTLGFDFDFHRHATQDTSVGVYGIGIVTAAVKKIVGGDKRLAWTLVGTYTLSPPSLRIASHVVKQSVSQSNSQSVKQSVSRTHCAARVCWSHPPPRDAQVLDMGNGKNHHTEVRARAACGVARCI